MERTSWIGSGDTCRLYLQPAHVEGLHRAAEAFERQFARGLELCPLVDGSVHLGVDQNLAVACLVAQARGEICDRAGRRILESPLEADASERGISVGYADPEPELMAVGAPRRGKRRDLVAHLGRHPDGPERRLRARQRIVEQHQQTVAGKTLDRTL